MTVGNTEAEEEETEADDEQKKKQKQTTPGPRSRRIASATQADEASTEEAAALRFRQKGAHGCPPLTGRPISCAVSRRNPGVYTRKPSLSAFCAAIIISCVLFPRGLIIFTSRSLVGTAETSGASGVRFLLVRRRRLLRAVTPQAPV